MDAVELLRSDSPFIADTSAWWRVASLPSELGALLQAAVIDDRLWITPIVRMEILYSARSTSEYVALETELDALYALGELAERSDGYHRVPPTDALIAAAAAEHGGIAVLHRDAHFDRLAEVLTFQGIHHVLGGEDAAVVLTQDGLRGPAQRYQVGNRPGDHQTHEDKGDAVSDQYFLFQRHGTPTLHDPHRSKVAHFRSNMRA